MSPENYTPFKRLEICTNILTNVQYFIEHKINDGHSVFPILIGSGGPVPRIWISNPNGENLVTDNKSKLWFIQIDYDEKLRTTSISIGNEIVLIATIGKETCYVFKLNLNPFGYNITGDDENGLKLGDSSFSGNSINGAKAFIVI